MATRNTKLIIKNSDIVNRPLPSSLLAGEGIVNTADGIMYFSGVTTSTTEWTPAGTGTTANFFEVGSNLYDLRLRNRITQYEGTSGAGLVGKFLSGTTNGFVLADISSIQGVDSYVTGGTYNQSTDTITLTLNEGKPNVNITGVTDYFTTGATLVGSVAYFDRNDTLSAFTLDLSTFISTGDTYVTAYTYDNANTFTISRNQGLPDLTATINTVTGLTVSGTLTANTINGGTILSGGTNLTDIFSQTDYYTTGATLIGNTAYFDRNDTLSAYTLDLSSLDINDTFVTGVTWNSGTNTLTVSRNEGEPDINVPINSFSGLSISNLTPGRVVYVGTAGLLTDEAGFEYDDGTNTMTVGNIDVTNDVTIQGDLTVLGASISAFTSELYIEDNNVILNYNPTGNTNVTSVNAGWTIQDGNGVSGDVRYNIVRMQNLTGLTATEIPDLTEYTASTGYANRGWATELNDIIIRSTDTTDDGTAGSVTGVRVLAEFDVLDGGNY